MGLSRRTLLMGGGGLVAGGGALIGTGAFSSVQAERTVSVETTGDASAFLGLRPTDNPNGDYAEGGGDTIQLTLDALNKNAITTIRNIVEVVNNGTQEVASVTLEFTDTPSGSINLDKTFTFLVDEGSNQDKIAHSSGGADILTGNGGISNTLGTGETIHFGIKIDLINGGDGNGDLPNGDYTLTITAQTSSDGSGGGGGDGGDGGDGGGGGGDGGDGGGGGGDGGDGGDGDDDDGEGGDSDDDDGDGDDGEGGDSDGDDGDDDDSEGGDSG